MSKTDAQRRAETKYAKNALRHIVFRLHKEYDSDIIAYLDSLENRQGEIKRLIRQEIAEKADEPRVEAYE